MDPFVGNIISESICEEKFDACAKKPSTRAAAYRTATDGDGGASREASKASPNEGRSSSLCEREMTVLRSNSIFRVVSAAALHFEE